MPRTGHDVIAVDEALAQGPAAMQAQIVDGVKVVAEPEDGDVPSADVHHLAGAGCEIADAANRNESVRHAFVSVLSVPSVAYLVSLKPAGMATASAVTSVVSFSISTLVVMMMLRCGLALPLLF